MSDWDDRLDGSTLELRYEKGLYKLLIDGEEVGSDAVSMIVNVPGALMGPRLTVFTGSLELHGGPAAIKRALLALRDKPSVDVVPRRYGSFWAKEPLPEPAPVSPNYHPGQYTSPRTEPFVQVVVNGETVAGHIVHPWPDGNLRIVQEEASA